MPEAVFCEGKSIATLKDLLARFANENEHPILFTRLSSDIFGQMPIGITSAYDYDPLSRTAYHTVLPRHDGIACAIISAGTADGFVSHEVARTLTYLGIPHVLYEDCGVAGLWRLTDRLDDINQADCVVVVAGMDAALASVVGGLTPKPIFAVPTSIGYGVADQGKAALMSMLASCAPGIGVLNINNGYGAACAVARVLLLLEKRIQV